MKINKSYASNIIEKALKGQKVGRGNGCNIVIVGDHGIKQSYTIRNFVNGSDSWLDTNTLTRFHGNWQYVRAQKSVWANTPVNVEIELQWL